MDFRLDERQRAVADVAEAAFAAAGERAMEGFDAELWKALGEGGLLGLAVGEEHGGAGCGLSEVAVLLEAQGAHAAPAPLWAGAVAALAIGRYGSAAQREAYLPGAADGSRPLTAALEAFEPVRVASGSLLTGTAACVPAAGGAHRILVAAGGGLLLVDPAGAGVTLEPARTLAGDPDAHVTFDGAEGERLGDADAAAWARRAAWVCVAALQLGTACGVTRLAASHLSEREQFGRPLATFQSIAHALADCHVGTEALRVLVQRAAWDLDHDAGDTETAALIAKWQAAETGERVAFTTQHLFGGIGLATGFPAHRYFPRATQLATTLGTADEILALLGDHLAVSAHRHTGPELG